MHLSGIPSVGAFFVPYDARRDSDFLTLNQFRKELHIIRNLLRYIINAKHCIFAIRRSDTTNDARYRKRYASNRGQIHSDE